MQSDKAKYAILLDNDNHFDLKDPIKFENVIRSIMENNNFKDEEAFKYFFEKHVKALAYHKGMVAAGFEFSGPEDLIERAERMLPFFRRFVGENLYNKIVEDHT